MVSYSDEMHEFAYRMIMLKDCTSNIYDDVVLNLNYDSNDLFIVQYTQTQVSNHT